MHMEENEKKSGCGCSSIIGFVLLVLAMTMVRTCSKSMVRGYYKNQPSSYSQVSSSPASSEEQLYQVMNDLKKSLPQRVDDVQTVVDMQMDEKSFYYVFEIDDAGSDFATMPYNELMELQIQQLKAVLPNMRAMLKSLVDAKRDLVYKYTGTSSGVTREFRISQNKIKALLEK